jgi:glutamate dehydrogenase/leucine dehydrogenase
MDTIYWNNNNAKGWLVIDKLTNGVCGGGTFMHSQATFEEVQLLAQTMSKKNQLNIIPFGGAKAGISFDPKHRDANEVLQEFLKFCQPYLETSWSTGADLNTCSENIEKIICSLGIKSGFHAIGEMYAKQLGIPNQCDKIRERVTLPVDKFFNLEKAIIGYSIARIMEQFRSNKPMPMAIHGFGNVGTSIGYYMEKMGVAQTVAIIDETGALIGKDTLSINTLVKLRKISSELKTLKQLANLYQEKHKAEFYEANLLQNSNYLAKFLQNIRVDIMAFCANRFAINAELVDILAKYTFNNSDHKFLIFGANLPFADQNLSNYATAKNIKFLPCWLTSAGNSVLYGAALSSKATSANWQMEILETISNHLIGKSRDLWNIPLIN